MDYVDYLSKRGDQEIEYLKALSESRVNEAKIQLILAEKAGVDVIVDAKRLALKQMELEWKQTNARVYQLQKMVATKVERAKELMFVKRGTMFLNSATRFFTALRVLGPGVLKVLGDCRSHEQWAKPRDLKGIVFDVPLVVENTLQLFDWMEQVYQFPKLGTEAYVTVCGALPTIVEDDIDNIIKNLRAGEPALLPVLQLVTK